MGGIFAFHLKITCMLLANAAQNIDSAFSSLFGWLSLLVLAAELLICFVWLIFLKGKRKKVFWFLLAAFVLGFTVGVLFWAAQYSEPYFSFSRLGFQSSAAPFVKIFIWIILADSPSFHSIFLW